ncbi:MAG: type IV pilin protein [Methylococcaceae bacterium]|jgi:type IV pilus assembly protein PilE
MNLRLSLQRKNQPRAYAGGKSVHMVGFTLIEVMLTAVIIALLTGIAVPSYQHYILRARRSEVQQFMLELAIREEEYFQINHVYGSLLNLGVAQPPEAVALNYALSVSHATAPPSYTLTATPLPQSAQEKDGPLSLDQRGTKLPVEKWR